MRITFFLVVIGLLAVFFSACASTTEDPAAVDKIDPVVAPRQIGSPIGTNSGNPVPMTMPTVY